MKTTTNAKALDLISGLVDEIDRCGVKVSAELESNARAYLAAHAAPKLPHPQDLAYTFARLLREELGDEIEDVIARNATETRAGICHSHDFCDANMTMAAAWEELTGYEPTNMESEAEASVWNEAWALAKASEFAVDCVSDDERSNGPRR